jgi:glycosyltransferase involved in cell wall biosynthesis
MDNHFTFLVTSYNCEAWVDKNLLSIHSQNYRNFEVYYVDDNSTDNTFEVASKYSNKKCIKNSFNRGKMYNVVKAIKEMQEDTIVVVVDGDDWLPNEEVLTKLNETYSSGNVWMTNGSYIVEPTKEIVKPRCFGSYWSGNIRKKSWEFSHLGTFRKKLFDKIKKKHLMSTSGEYWATTSDQAIMWPLAEMCGPEHHRIINDVLYVYNRLNPLSDDRVNRIDQLDTERVIRSFSPYERLVEL